MAGKRGRAEARVDGVISAGALSAGALSAGRSRPGRSRAGPLGRDRVLGTDHGAEPNRAASKEKYRERTGRMYPATS